MSTVDAAFLRSYVPPCRQIQTVISTGDVDNFESTDNFTAIDIRFKSVGYKMVRDVRAFNEESLIGNLGGYVGLFLGVAIWQTPDFIGFVVRKLKSYC